MPLSYAGIAAGSQAQSAQLKQILDLLTGVMTDQQVTLSSATSYPLLLNRADAAGIKPLLGGYRASSPKWWIGFNAGDNFAVLDFAGTSVNFSLTDLGAATIRAALSATDLTATGVASLGSAAAGRYVGNWTTFGSPTGLTAIVGDHGFDGNGAIWVCTAAGTPGTWITYPMGLLSGGYAQQGASQTLIGATQVDLTSLSCTVTVGSGRRIKITSLIPFTGTVSTDNYLISIFEGATQVGSVAGPVVAAAGGGAARAWFAPSAILQPSAGAHTYKLTGQRANGTGTGSTVWTSQQPVWMAVEDIGV